MSRRTKARIAAFGILFAGGALAATTTLAPVPAPPENQPSEAKRVLGKILFWDEQLSADGTISCGSCHVPDKGGSDPRRAVHPGPDGVFGTADDVFGSPGVVHQDASGNYAPHAVFGLDVQVTPRAAPSFLTGALADSLFWDGRASTQFVDPQTGQVAIASGGALESQAVGPVLSATEMGREGRTWDEVAAKLQNAAPLLLSTDVPPDVAAALTDSTRYPDLFAAAFGDGEITARRIAFAIAAYERTLVPDQTPWDAFIAGDASALSAAQQRGWAAFQASHCIDCHKAPEFTDRSFHDIGLRPATDDKGREVVTGDSADAGKFKTPSLRDVNLRASHMHTGQFTTIPDVLRFYARAPGAARQFTDNLDPIVTTIQLPAPAAADIQSLLETGLTDARSAAEQFPFDYPTTYSENRVNGPTISESGVAGSGGATPQMIAVTPPYLGNAEFRLGVAKAKGGAQAFVAVSSAAPVSGRIAPETLLGPITLQGSGDGAGYGTMTWPVPDDASRDGEHAWFQWRVVDAAAAGGYALSPVAAVTLFAVKTTAARVPSVTDDSSLYLDSASFAVDWRSHARNVIADSFAASGVLNLGGAKSVAGRTLVVSFAGTELVRATLGADGRARGASVDASSGRFVVAASGVDLRAATGLDALAGRGAIQRDVVVSLDAATATASVPFAWTTSAGRVSRGTYRFARDGLVSGAFLARHAVARVADDGTFSLRVVGLFDLVGGGSSAPTGDVGVAVGGAGWTLSAASRVVSGRTTSPTVAYALAGSPSIRFSYVATTRTFTLVADGLPASLLGDAAATTASLPVELTMSDGGTLSTDVAVRRASASAKTWTR